MATWKVLVTVVFGILCLSLGWTTVVVGISGALEPKWPWFAGLLFATLCTSTLFALFLRSADRSFLQDSRHR